MIETLIAERGKASQDTQAEAVRRRVNNLLFGVDSNRRLELPADAPLAHWVDAWASAPLPPERQGAIAAIRGRMAWLVDEDA